MPLLRAAHVGLILCVACSSDPPQAEEAPPAEVPARREAVDGAPEGVTVAAWGAALYRRHGCDECHELDEAGTGPPLRRIWGSEARAVDGRTIRVEGDAGAALIAESMRAPNAFLLVGYPPLMPRFDADELPDREVAAITATLRCLADPAPADCAGVAEAFAGRP